MESLFSEPKVVQNYQNATRETPWCFNIIPITKIDFTTTPKLKPEIEEGPIEYKWNLSRADNERIQHLSTQMRWRLSEGNGHALYRLGIEDDGSITGFPQKDFSKNMNVFFKVLKVADAEKVTLYKRKLTDIMTDPSTIKEPNTKSQSSVRFAVDIHIRRKDNKRVKQMKTMLIGPAGAGKSTLIGVLSQGVLDDGHGLARFSTFKHKHEIISGRTSNASNGGILGFDTEGKALNFSQNDNIEEIIKRSDYLISLIDVAGLNKYQHTLLHGIAYSNPHSALIIIQECQMENYLKNYVNLLRRVYIKILAIVITHCDESTMDESKSFQILRSVSEPNAVPIVKVDCISGFGIEQLKSILFDEIKLRTNLCQQESIHNYNSVPTCTEINLEHFESDKMSNPILIKPKVRDPKNYQTIFKIEDTIQFDVGTIVTGFTKSGQIKENDILILGPVEQVDNDKIILDKSSFSEDFSKSFEDECDDENDCRSLPLIVSDKVTKRKRPLNHSFSKESSSPIEKISSKYLKHSNETHSMINSELLNNSNSSIDSQNYKNIKVRVLSIETNRVRCSTAYVGELCALRIKPVLDEQNKVFPYVVKRGATIYSEPIDKQADNITFPEPIIYNNSYNNLEIVECNDQNIYKREKRMSSNFSYVNKIKLKLLNSQYKIDLKIRQTVSIFYDTAKLAGIVLSNGWQHEDNINFIDIELTSFELIRIGDKCLLSCLRNLTDVSRVQIL